MRANNWPVRVEENVTRHGAEQSGKKKRTKTSQDDLRRKSGLELQQGAVAWKL